MKFEVSEIGNRIIIKTRKNGEITKITPLAYKKALRTILNLQKNNQKVTLEHKTQNYTINSLF